MAQANLTLIPCPVCKGPLELRVTQSKSGKPGLMRVCPKDPRHFRGFIKDREYVDRVLTLLKEQEKDTGGELDD